jgi:hypothetical protein
MPAELKLNPYAAFAAEIVDGGDCILVAPKVGESLQVLTISQSECPALYSLFAELSAVGLNTLDVENDLDDEARDLLARFGVLVTDENTPQKPLYSCLLDDVKVDEIARDESALRVNPTFRFEQFDLSKFRALSVDKHFSPYLPTAWIKSRGVELDLGFWVDHEHASLFSQLRAGEPFPDVIDSKLRVKLAAAGIIVDPQVYDETEKIAAGTISDAQKLFSQSKYATLKNVIPEAQVRAMQVFYRAYIEQGFILMGDTRVQRRFREPNEPLARFFHLSLAGLMSKLVGCEVKPSYCYAASYREGADLPPHIDREACEYSFSIQIDYEPEPGDGVSPWALGLSTRELNDNTKYLLEWKDFEPGQETERALYLGNGDCLAYRGRDLAHYRSQLPVGHKSTSLFFHYVPMDYDGLI